jgi:hypothetical protein
VWRMKRNANPSVTRSFLGEEERVRFFEGVKKGPEILWGDLLEEVSHPSYSFAHGEGIKCKLFGWLACIVYVANEAR